MKHEIYCFVISCTIIRYRVIILIKIIASIIFEVYIKKIQIYLHPGKN